MVEESKLECDVLVYGASLEALHVLTRLDTEILKKTMVVDPSGTWLTDLEKMIHKLGVNVMRTPCNIHPSPKALALKYFAKETKREKELYDILPGFASLPSGKLFLDFCKHLVNTLPSDDTKVVLRDNIVDVAGITALHDLPDSASHNHNVIVTLKSGRCVQCKALVVAAPDLKPVVPAWLKTQCIPKCKTYMDLDFSQNADIDGKIVTVVGGGMMAATLASHAIAKGAAKVHLVARRRLKARPFDCEVGWWGLKYLHGFLDIADKKRRMKRCREAKNQGSVSPVVFDTLVSAAAQGTLCVFEDCSVSHVDVVDGTARLSLIKNQNSLRDQSIFMKRVHDTCPDMDLGQPNEDEENIFCDELWVACGNAFDVEEHPVLRLIQNKFPVELVGGYPTLLDESCAWNGAPVFVVGRGSMLSVGPAALDLPGMKLSSEKISSTLNSKIEADNMSELWIKQNFSADSQVQHFDPVLRTKEWVSYEQKNQDMDESIRKALAKESEGIIYSDLKPKSNDKRPTLIDISDVDESLPRQEIQQFSFIDDDFEVSVVLNFPEPVEEQSVRMKVTNTSLEAWIIGEQKAYRLHVPNLYGKILPERSRIVAKPKKNRVILVLHKERDVEWRFLKG